VAAETLHEELGLLAHLTSDVHLRHGPDGRWIAVQETVREMLGYEPEALVGRRAIELVHPADRPRVERALRAALPVSDTLGLELRIVRLDGTVMRADVRFDAVRDRAGAITEHRVTLHDPKDRRRAEELSAQWELLFRTTRRGIAVTDPRTGVLAAVNPAYAAMHGGVVSDFVGLPLACVLAPASAARIGALAAQIDEQGFLSYESQHLRTDGTTFPAAVDVVAARGADGEQAYWLAWVEDLTDRRRAEEAAARFAEEMTRSNEDLDRFAAVVSHDLQSPLRVIAGCARLLERRVADRLDESERELIDHILGGTRRMSRLLDGVREYSRVREDGAAPRPVDTAEVVAEVMASLRAELDAAGATVRVGRLPTVAAHAVGLAQVLQNLIGNALKFRSAAPPEIAIWAEPGEGEWLFTVADNGIGIDPRHAGQVFEFGRRLHGDDEIPGTGIGLTVCKSVVERHGGRIWVAPRPGGGSRFQFALPAPAA
jgi:PAS domain S-box-containing protein